MDLFNNLWIGLESAVSLTNLLYCFVGVSLGTLVGVLPGMGPVATVAMLLPITYALDPSAALIMLAGIYYGAQYGGSTTAILVNIPGEAAAVVTCLDGHKLAKMGRAGAALGVAAIGSFCAGCFATVLIAAFAEPLTSVAFEFGAREYFSLMVLGLVGAVVLASGSLLKAIGMIFIGILLGCVGMDVNSGALRYVFGVDELMDGFDFVALSMGVYGFAEIIKNLEQNGAREAMPAAVGRVLPTKEDMKVCAGPIARGTVVGSLLGILPGGGALLSSFASYTMEKKIAGEKADPPFGSGNIRGVAGPESANNAGAQTSFIPMLTLGIPSNAVMALMIGALMLHDIAPGPQVMSTNPSLFWGLIVSMWIGNVFLIVLNIPLIGLWVRLLRVPYRLLYPAILVFCAIGVYSISNNPFDIWITIGFGIFGWLANKFGCEGAPLILGFILGPMLEENMRRALLLSRGDLSTFVTGPISGTLLAISALLLIIVILPSVRSGREKAFVED
ncbi:tripartite tricarboxylate transporter permease [Sutterella sp.]|uniref:tripartite tricarboxylate transporter permease n=1 Tax=Sutterella sp. TaxID=1981025 RepID=UPI0026DF3A8F|nr:tripartite tricarboxylate transporter permease [Sutterella sp.]MDO5531307.1 tripartite tricarboxylate transporter permease [Sutterella sp.]